MTVKTNALQCDIRADAEAMAQAQPAYADDPEVARAAGADILLAKTHPPVVRAVLLAAPAGEPRELGLMTRKRKVPDDIGSHLAQEIENMFYGKPEEKK
jgi:hypothetical protein